MKSEKTIVSQSNAQKEIIKVVRETDKKTCGSSDTPNLMEQQITQSDEKSSLINFFNVASNCNFKCPTCSKIFSTKSKLQQHCLLNCVKQQDSLTCKECSKKFINNYSLTRHFKIHQSK